MISSIEVFWEAGMTPERKVWPSARGAVFKITWTYGSCISYHICLGYEVYHIK